MFMSRFSVFAVLAVSLIVPASVLAASATTSTSSVATSHASTTPAATTTPNTPTTTPTKSEAVALNTTAQTRIINLTANLSNREDATVRRLQNVSNRLVARLALIKAAGKDVHSAESHLADTASKLALAKSSLTTIDKAVTAFVGSSNPQESWVNLKTTYTTINATIRAAYEALKAAVTAAEAASVSTQSSAVTATTTATSTTTTTATTTKAKR